MGDMTQALQGQVTWHSIKTAGDMTQHVNGWWHQQHKQHTTAVHERRKKESSNSAKITLNAVTQRAKMNRWEEIDSAFTCRPNGIHTQRTLLQIKSAWDTQTLSQGRHAIDRLEERGAEKGSGRWSASTGWDRAIVNQTTLELFYFIC